MSINKNTTVANYLANYISNIGVKNIIDADKARADKKYQERQLTKKKKY